MLFSEFLLGAVCGLFFLAIGYFAGYWTKQPSRTNHQTSMRREHLPFSHLEPVSSRELQERLGVVLSFNELSLFREFEARTGFELYAYDRVESIPDPKPDYHKHFARHLYLTGRLAESDQPDLSSLP